MPETMTWIDRVPIRGKRGGFEEVAKYLLMQVLAPLLERLAKFHSAGRLIEARMEDCRIRPQTRIEFGPGVLEEEKRTECRMIVG